MEEFSVPTVFECKRFLAPGSITSARRIVKDYEFDFYLRGQREMIIDGTSYAIEKGSLVLRRPGQEVQSAGPYDCYILTLDYSGRPFEERYARNRARDIQPNYNWAMWELIPPVFIPRHQEDYLRIFQRLTSILSPNPNDDPDCPILIAELLHLLSADTLYTRVSPAVSDTMDEVCGYIRTNFSEDITLTELAGMAHLNKSYFVREFKKRVGTTPVGYLINIRLEHAKTLLQETGYPVKAVAGLCGYKDPSFFSSYFKKRFGLTPEELRSL